MTLLLAIIDFIILASWPLPIFFVECFVQSSTLTHSMLGIFLNGAGTIHELGIVGVVAALRAMLMVLTELSDLRLSFCLPLEPSGLSSR